MQYQNPIIGGFHPDPSICRVGEDYYLVTSTFEFFPGVPVYHSRNLTDWELITHVLTTPEQLPLEGAPSSKGIYAPTLRYHDGVFYMVTTNTTGGGNFIVHATDIRGPWSAPAWVDQAGIDPSLLFDGEEVIFCSNYRTVKNGISACRVDPKTGRRQSEVVTIGTGLGGRSCEAPHLYHIGDYYYLMLAEGGTEYGHMVTIQRGKSPWGPFVPCPHNPILTHRDYKLCQIQCTGHGDLFEDHRGNWWMVFLGTRSLTPERVKVLMLHNLGRETFLAPVTWEDGWPVVGNNGRVELQMEGPLWEAPRQPRQDWQDDFAALRPQWNFVRNPREENYRFGSGLTLTAGSEKLGSPAGSPTALLRRQQAFCTEVTAQLRPGAGDCYGGLTVYLNHQHHYDVFLSRQNGALSVGVRRSAFDLCAETARVPLEQEGPLWLRVCSDMEYYHFAYSVNGADWLPLGRGSTGPLCSEVVFAMNFTGTHLGLFCDEGSLQAAGFHYREL